MSEADVAKTTVRYVIDHANGIIKRLDDEAMSVFNENFECDLTGDKGYIRFKPDGKTFRYYNRSRKSFAFQAAWSHAFKNCVNFNQFIVYEIITGEHLPYK